MEHPFLLELEKRYPDIKRDKESRTNTMGDMSHRVFPWSCPFPSTDEQISTRRLSAILDINVELRKVEMQHG
jgi:hypothetical protein